MQQLDALTREIAMQVEMNQELKSHNHELKIELLSQQKALARFEANLRQNPLSQLKILHQELVHTQAQLDTLLENKNTAFSQELLTLSKAICTDAFALLNDLKKKVAQQATNFQTK